jgi:hypothetical protein
MFWEKRSSNLQFKSKSVCNLSFSTCIVVTMLAQTFLYVGAVDVFLICEMDCGMHNRDYISVSTIITPTKTS